MEACVTEDAELQRQSVRQTYDDALIKFKEAQQALEDTLRGLHRIGEYPPPPKRLRFCLADERGGKNRKFDIGTGEGSIEGYITSGTYSSGELGEIFIVAQKQGSFVSGLMDGFATVFSIALQHGVPLESLISKFRHTRFEPAGYTKDDQIKNASSVLDFVMQWLELRYTAQPKEEADGSADQ
jgi:hypothetical protein